MKPNLRKFALSTHITLCVGWIGAVLAYLVLVVAAMASQSDPTLRASWIAMELIGWYVIVPLAFAALLTGLIMSLGTPWGLFRHYWVVISFMATMAATAVLMQHMPTVSYFAGVAAFDSANAGELRGALRGELLHAGVGVVVLLAIQMLNVYKPQGMLPFARQKTSEAASPARPTEAASIRPDRRPTGRTPRWARVVGLHAIGLALLFVVFHFTTGGMGGH